MPVKSEVYEEVIRRAKDYMDSRGPKDYMRVSGVTSQKNYIAALHMQPAACWECGKTFNYYEGATESYDLDKYRGSEEEFYCPYCGVEQVHVVPLFFAQGNAGGWLWGNPRIYGDPKREPRRITPAYTEGEGGSGS